ncbi:MAG TPA: aldehyde dehydrogenase family protein [Pseudolysinimonas sp.]|nr:aldehyde dehydrogenase family protein [Pseudolysinimonas sp.]
MITTVNPATGAALGEFPAQTADDLNQTVDAAVAAHASWRRVPPLERAKVVLELARALEAEAESLARLDSAENGSLLSEMRRDVAGGIAAMRYFAGLTLQMKGSSIPSGAGELTYTTRVPFGVVGRIVPFNHPFMFAASKIAAPLIAGNSVVLKPSEYTSLSALRIAELAQGIVPAGVLGVVTGWGLEVGDALVGHPAVTRLAFTGSVATGLAIQRRAAESTVKTVTLELGGKNPLVVFPDADIEVATEAAVRGMNFTWQGQSCGSLSRNIVHDDIYDEFVERLTERVGSLRPGLPDHEQSQTGAIVNERQLEKVLEYVEIGKAGGATLTTGGVRLTEGALGAGNFVAPAVFADVDIHSRLAQEEIFGPVLSVSKFSDEADALAKANATQFGLTASVFTNDLGVAHRFAQDIDAGYVWVNEVSRHLPGSPYGGVKNSGVGREEELDELLSYTQVKNVHINFKADAAK